MLIGSRVWLTPLLLLLLLWVKVLGEGLLMVLLLWHAIGLLLLLGCPLRLVLAVLLLGIVLHLLLLLLLRIPCLLLLL